jgi:hypothetical protein
MPGSWESGRPEKTEASQRKTAGPLPAGRPSIGISRENAGASTGRQPAAWHSSSVKYWSQPPGAEQGFGYTQHTPVPGFWA